MGSVQLLDNGNYLLYTFGSGLNQGQPTLREVTSDYEVVWNYQGLSNAAWYRTYKIPSLHPDAFSVIASGYTVLEDESMIELFGNSLDFTIHNKSGYSLAYKYMFTEQMEGGTPVFFYDEGVVDIEPYGSAELSFSVNSAADITATQVMLAIWPDHHEYAVKELNFNVTTNDSILGDINLDGDVNVLDVVSTVNIVLSEEYNPFADLNGDNLNNVLDIVLLIGIILN